jgi:hypothetical protein
MCVRDLFYEWLIAERQKAARRLQRLTSGTIVSSETWGPGGVRVDDLASEKANYRSRIEVCNNELRAYEQR